jgi:hypothetical protein
MDATLTVPADFVPHLRRGLFGEWGAAAEKLSSLALQFGTGAPDGVYMPPLQTFFTLCVLLGEVGWKDMPAERDVVINLGVTAPQITKALREEHQVLVQQLEEMPASTANKGIRDAAAAMVAEFEDFIRSVETQAARARRRRLKPTPIRPTSRPPLSPGVSRSRRATH